MRLYFGKNFSGGVYNRLVGKETGDRGNSCKNLAILHRREKCLPQENTEEETYTKEITEAELMGLGTC